MLCTRDLVVTYQDGCRSSSPIAKLKSPILIATPLTNSFTIYGWIYLTYYSSNCTTSILIYQLGIPLTWWWGRWSNTLSGNWSPSASPESHPSTAAVNYQATAGPNRITCNPSKEGQESCNPDRKTQSCMSAESNQFRSWELWSATVQGTTSRHYGPNTRVWCCQHSREKTWNSTQWTSIPHSWSKCACGV